MNDSLNYFPAYTITEVAKFLGIPPATVRTWVKGRKYSSMAGEYFSKPLILGAGSSLLSFTNLIEVHVLRVIRKVHGVRLDKVRTALDYLEQEFGVSHPLATVKFRTDGLDLFVESLNRLLNVSRSGQLAMRSALEGLLTQVEYNAQEAIRFYPVIKSIVIDPTISFGKPVLVGTGVPTSSIVSLYNAGDEIEDIANEFSCSIEQVKAAIHYEAELLVA